MYINVHAYPGALDSRLPGAPLLPHRALPSASKYYTIERDIDRIGR